MSDLFGSGDPGFDISVFAIDAIIAEITQYVNGIFLYLADQTQWIAESLDKLEGTVSEGTEKTARSIGAIAGGGLLDGIRRLGKKIKVLGDRLGGFIPKVLDLLKQLRDWIDIIFNRFIVPVLRLIQHIRQMLVYLRLLHIHIADKLDKWLQQAQVEITKPFAVIRGTLNGVIDVLTIMLEPWGVLKAAPLLWGLWKNVGDIAALLHLGSLIGVPSIDAGRRKYFASNFTPTDGRAIAQLNAKGQFDAVQQGMQADFQDAMQRVQSQ